MTLTKKKIVSNISSKTGVTSDESNRILTKFLHLIVSYKDKSDVKISNFGTFSLKKTKDRLGRNPKTGESYKISSYNKLVFNSSNKIRRIIN